MKDRWIGLDKNIVISISRKYGCGGRELAQILAEKLNIKLYDRKIVHIAAAKLETDDLNENDLLESGVELMVKFKNKKYQSLSLLSGGEKSMVAVALIMAIFMYKPSPFTFFDEIEAALDESNTKRLLGKLKEFTDKSQFILITHNKHTMKESDQLYGVTMNKEIGESKILSVVL